MPHVSEHKEFDPVDFLTEERPLEFAPVDFGIGQGRTEQQYVPDNNSIVTVPAGSSASFASRESKEFIEGQSGFYGNTPTINIFDLGTPGGFANAEDFKKFFGGIADAAVVTTTGRVREEVILLREKQFPTPANIEAALIDIVPLVSAAIEDFGRGEQRAGISKLADAFGRVKQVAPPDIFRGPFKFIAGLAVKANPQISEQFDEKMLELQANSEDFLIRNGLLFGEDDEPTFVGNLLQQTGLSLSALGLGYVLKSPAIAAGIFGSIQQVSTFQEAEEAGKDPFTAAAIANINAAIETSITFVEVGAVINIVQSRKVSIVKKILSGFVAEGVEEGTTEALTLSVQNITGVTDLTLDESLNQIFQATFYGAIAGGGVTGSLSIVQNFTQGTGISEEEIDKIVAVLNDVVIFESEIMTQQAIDDTNTELELDRDIISGKPITKAAKATMEQQEKLVKILQDVNEGKEIDLKVELDEIFPEARIQRQKARLEEARGQRAETLERNVLREALIELDTEMQIAEQEGDEARIGDIAERINEIQKIAVSTESLRETVQELQDEGIFVADSPLLDEALADIDDVLRPLRAGVRVGKALQKEETVKLQDALTKIVQRLGAVIDPKAEVRLQRKIRKVNTIKNAESIRRDIIRLARKSAFKKFVRERRIAIDDAIKSNTKAKVGELDADSQNALDSMNKMRLGMKSATKVVKAEEADAKQVIETRQRQVSDFNVKQSKRIQKDMGQGIPIEGVTLQVRYLDILNEKSRATPEAVAKFEDDLDAFIETGKGLATLADAENQAIVDAAKEQAFSNEVTDIRADIENDLFAPWDKLIRWAAESYESVVRVLQLKGTPFDLFNAEVSFRQERNRAKREIDALIDVVSDGDGNSYRKELRDKRANVINVPREGHTIELGGNQSKNIRMTRGQLIYSWMLLREDSIRKQMTDPRGRMAWTDEFVAMIEQRMTEQDIAFAEGLFEIYSNSYERFNEVYRRVYNRDLTRVEHYSHISREGIEGLDESTHNETMFIDMIAPEDREGSLVFGREPREAKERVENASAEIKIGNVLDMHDKYTYDVEHFISHAEAIRLMDTLLKDKEFVRHLQEILTPGGFINFVEHVQLSSRTNRNAQRTHNMIEKVAEKLRSNVFRASLGLNLKIGLGQMATVSSWAADMPKSDFGSGVQDYSVNPLKANKILNEHPTFGERELNFDSDIEQTGDVEGLFKFLTVHIRKGDGWAVRAGAWARYKWLIEKKGVSPEAALQDVAEFAERSQQSTLPSQRSLAQKSQSPIVRTLTMFKSSPMAMFNVSLQSITEYRQADKSTSAKKAAARKKLIETLVVQNIVIPALYSLLTGRGLTTTVIIGSTAGVPVLSDLLEILVGVIVNIFREEDEPVFTAGPLAEIPISEAIEQASIAVVGAGDLARDLIWEGLDEALDDVSMGSVMESMAGIVEVSTGIPMSNSMDMYEGARQLYETDDSLDAILQILGFKEAARKRTLERLDAIPGIDTGSDSDRIVTQGVFP